MTLLKALLKADEISVMGERYQVEQVFEAEFNYSSEAGAIVVIRNGTKVKFTFTELNGLLSHEDLEVYTLTKMDLTGI